MKIHIARRKVIDSLALIRRHSLGDGNHGGNSVRTSRSRGWLVLFDLDKEWNLPTIFSALLFFAASAVWL